MPADPTESVYAGLTVEERTAGRRQRFLDAGLNLFGTVGYGSVRIKDMCAEAGLTERYFYQNFRDLDDLFEQVLTHTIVENESRVSDAVADLAPGSVERITAALRVSIEGLAEDPRKIRLIFVEALRRGGSASTRRHEFALRAAGNFLKWSGTANSGDDNWPVARAKAIAIAGAISELLISWAEGLIDITPQQIADVLVGLYWRANLP